VTIRSSKTVESVASDLYDALRGVCAKLHGVGYTHDKDGYIIILYHCGVPARLQLTTPVCGYRIRWERAQRPEPA